MTEKTVMMKEELISFETAKLASEVCFDIITKYIYCSEYKNRYLNTYTCSEQMYWCPTQSLLQKWFREKYEFELWVQPVVEGIPEYEAYKEYKYIYLGFSKKTGEGFSGGSKNASFERTLEIGLQEALNLI